MSLLLAVVALVLIVATLTVSGSILPAMGNWRAFSVPIAYHGNVFLDLDPICRDLALVKSYAILIARWANHADGTRVIF